MRTFSKAVALFVLFLSLLVQLVAQGELASRAASPAGAQDSLDRGVVLGIVAGDGDRKQVGAEVVLISRPFPARVDVGELDVVRVISDATGRFRAKCLRGRAYSAWATWVDESGAQWSTSIAEGVVPGPIVRLHEASLSKPVEIKIRGLAAWRELGEVTATAYSHSKNAYGRPLAIAADGTAVLPFLPGTHWEVEVRAANGLLIRLAQIRRAPTEVEVSGPREWRVQVANEQGAPIGGAAVAQIPCYAPGGRHLRMVSVPLAKTDQLGRATVVLPAMHPMTNGKRSQTLEVRSPGHASRLANTADDNGGPVTVVSVTMRDGYELKGQLVDAHQQPIVGIEVFVEHPIELQGADNSRWLNPPLPVRTDGDGRFAVNGLGDWSGCRVMLMLKPSEARLVGFATEADRSLAPIQWIAAVEKVVADIDLGPVCLADIPMCRLTIVGHDKVPAAEARVRLLHAGSLQPPIEFATDRVGRLQMAYPDANTRIGVYVPGGGIALAVVPSAETHEIRLSLMETRIVTGKVVDEAGKPVAGAVVKPWDRLRNCGFQLADLAYRSYGSMGATGADGKFRVTLPMVDVAFSIRATATIEQRPASSKVMLVAPDEQNVELVVVAR